MRIRVYAIREFAPLLDMCGDIFEDMRFDLKKRNLVTADFFLFFKYLLNI